MNTNNNSDKINDFTEPHAWVDARLSQLCLQEPENQDEDRDNEDTFLDLLLFSAQYLEDKEEEKECEYDEVLLARKRQKLYDENMTEDIPMEISDDEYETNFISEAEDEGTELDNDMLSDMSDIEYSDAEEDYNVDIILEDGYDGFNIPMEEIVQPSIQRQTTSWEHNGTVVYNGNPNGSRLFDDEDDDDMPDLLPMLSIQRQTTHWEHNGTVVYNGNPNGSRLFDDEDEDDMPDLIAMEVINEEEEEEEEKNDYHADICELEVQFGNGQNVFCEEDAERVDQLRGYIAEYESKNKK